MRITKINAFIIALHVILFDLLKVHETNACGEK